MRARTAALATIPAILAMISCGDESSPTGPTAIDAPAAVAAVSYDFDPTPPARIAEGDTGHFRVNVTRDGRRSRVTEGVTSSAPDVLRLALEGDRWRYTGIVAGSAEIRVAQGGSRRLTHAVEVAAPTVSYAFDPTPPARITEGDTGHFRVNVTRDGRRSRVTEGVTSSAPGVLRLNLEGDRWRYTGTGPGSAEIRVTQGGSHRLTHSVRVMDRPEPWRRSGTTATIIDLPTRITRIRIEGEYHGSSENFMVWCGTVGNRGGLLVNEVLGTFFGSTTYSGVHSALRSYGGRGQPCRQLEIGDSGVRWTITETSPRSGFTSPSTGGVRGDEAAVRRAREQVDRAMNATRTR